MDPFLVDIRSSWAQLADFVLDDARTARIDGGELERVLDEIGLQWHPMSGASWASAAEALEDENFHALAAAARTRARALEVAGRAERARPSFTPPPSRTVRSLLAQEHSYVSRRVNTLAIVAAVSAGAGVGVPVWQGQVLGGAGWVGAGLAVVAAVWLSFRRTPAPWAVAVVCAGLETTALAAERHGMGASFAAFAVLALLGVAPTMVAAARER